MKILVTGGCGFIGANFIHYLLKAHPRDRVVNLDKLTYAADPENLASLADNPRYSFVKGDICNGKLVMEAAAGCEAVVNFAAESHVDRSILRPETFIQTNVVGVSVILEACRQLKIRRLLQVSSDEVYGSIARGAAREEDPLRPSSPYSSSKAAGDLLCLAYHQTYRLPVVLTRSTNNYGPRQYPEKLIPLFISRALADEYLPLYGRGKNCRDWLFVEDNCRAIDLVLRRGREGTTYNIGAGQRLSNHRVAGMLLKLLEKPTALIRQVPDRPGHDWRYAVDCRRIHKLGWKPATTFREGLKITVDWYRNRLA